jgi:hypothetical protein
MAQIIKQRRGSINGLKDVTARQGELIVATGSIGDMNGPWIFIGNDEVAGGYRAISKIYEGSSVPTISAGSYGTTIDGTAFYSTTEESLYVLSSTGNRKLDFSGNIEGNIISAVTINNLTGTTATIANVSGSFTGSGAGLYDIPAGGIVGLELNRISEGSATASITQADGLKINTKTEITGTLIVTSDITGSNLYLSGDAKIDGNITLGGNITVGDADTDSVTFAAEISSSIVPDVHNSFDLGSASKNWRNLHVSGTAYVDTLEARQVNFTDLGVLEDLTVSGSTFLGNGGDVTVISGSIFNDQLTEKRLVVVGAGGLLMDYSGLTFDNSNLNLSGALQVTNIQGTGSLYLKADKDDLRHFEIYNTSVSDTHIKSNGGLSFFGDDTNYLKIDDSLQTATIVGVNGVIVNSSLQVTGTTELQGAVGMNSSLDVTGSAQFKSTINVDSEATLASATVEDLTENRIVGVGVGGSLIDYSGLTYDGTTFKVGNGQFEIDNNDGDIRTSGSLTSNGLTNNGDLTVNGVLTVTGNTQLGGNLYVSGNLEVLGGATSVIIQSTTIELDDNIIRLNAYSPFERYAGFEVIDSGSSGVSASLVWDSLGDYWMFVSSSGQSSKLIGTTAGTYGSENSLNSGTFPIATGDNNLGNSLLNYVGTVLSFNTNKFTVDSINGDTSISGGVTLSFSGGTDNGNNTSSIVFKNSSDVLGFVTTTETTDVLDGILGYKNSNGALVFSTVIDGGTF